MGLQGIKGDDIYISSRLRPMKIRFMALWSVDFVFEIIHPLMFKEVHFLTSEEILDDSSLPLE